MRPDSLPVSSRLRYKQEASSIVGESIPSQFEIETVLHVQLWTNYPHIDDYFGDIQNIMP